MAELIYKEEVYQIIGAAMEVHRSLGCGFLEAIYQEALEMEFANRGIAFCPQKELVVDYKGHHLKKSYNADFTVLDKILVEIKAISSGLTSIDEAQIINYLKATGYIVGVLINFGKESLEWKRKIFTPKSSENS
jgi:GxxExxY protein